MDDRIGHRPILALAMALGMLQVGCGPSGAPAGLPAAQAPSVARAVCGAHDRQEPGFAGQVPAGLRTSGGFAGFNCNLEPVGQSRGEGAGWQHAFVTDRAGRACSYFDTSPATANRAHAGVVVIDAANPEAPTVAGYLTSPAMLDPLESLKVNARRRLLAAVSTINDSAGPGIELYDLTDDCRAPRRVSAPLMPASADRDGRPPLRADEGAFAPDGLTYYATNLRSGVVFPIDVRDRATAQVLARWSMPFNQRTSGLSISEDGSRAYLTLYGRGSGAMGLEDSDLDNGIVIADVSDVQARKPNPQIKVISSLVWGDGSGSHQTIPISIRGHPYLVVVDEGGSGASNASGWVTSCAMGLPPWSMARIVDIGDEAAPTVVAKLQLEMNAPAHCQAVIPDLSGLSGFTYGSHYCSVDNKKDTTTLACGYFESGIRVFDIRQPTAPKEIAYFVPPAVAAPSPGSQNSRLDATGRPDHCSAQPRLDAAAATLATVCQDNGYLALKFTNGVWPFSTSSTESAEQN